MARFAMLGDASAFRYVFAESHVKAVVCSAMVAVPTIGQDQVRKVKCLDLSPAVSATATSGFKATQDSKPFAHEE